MYVLFTRLVQFYGSQSLIKDKSHELTILEIRVLSSKYTFYNFYTFLAILAHFTGFVRSRGPT